MGDKKKKLGEYEITIKTYGGEMPNTSYYGGIEVQRRNKDILHLGFMEIKEGSFQFFQQYVAKDDCGEYKNIFYKIYPEIEKMIKKRENIRTIYIQKHWFDELLGEKGATDFTEKFGFSFYSEDEVKRLKEMGILERSSSGYIKEIVPGRISMIVENHKKINNVIKNVENNFPTFYHIKNKKDKNIKFYIEGYIGKFVIRVRENKIVIKEKELGLNLETTNEEELEKEIMDYIQKIETRYRLETIYEDRTFHFDLFIEDNQLNHLSQAIKEELKKHFANIDIEKIAACYNKQEKTPVLKAKIGEKNICLMIFKEIALFIDEDEKIVSFKNKEKAKKEFEKKMFELLTKNQPIF